MKPTFIISDQKPTFILIPNMLQDPDWMDFENNFEEGWHDEPTVFTLAIQEHHREVANLAAYRLSLIFGTQDLLLEKKYWEDVIQTAYNKAAEELYPNERLWSGDHSNDPDFWYAHCNQDPQKIKDLWIGFELHEDYGPYESYQPKVSNFLNDEQE